MANLNENADPVHGAEKAHSWPNMLLDSIAAAVVLLNSNPPRKAKSRKNLLRRKKLRRKEPLFPWWFEIPPFSIW
jgi:hypothetical protein